MMPPSFGAEATMRIHRARLGILLALTLPVLLAACSSRCGIFSRGYPLCGL